MTNENSSLYARLLTIETRLQEVLLRLNANEVRLATVEQKLAQMATTLGFGGGGSSGGAAYPAVSTSTITGSGASPGSGTATLRQSLGGGAYSNLQSVTVYSTLTNTIASGKNLMVSRDTNGQYWVMTGDC